MHLSLRPCASPSRAFCRPSTLHSRGHIRSYSGESPGRAPTAGPVRQLTWTVWAWLGVAGAGWACLDLSGHVWACLGMCFSASAAGRQGSGQRR